MKKWYQFQLKAIHFCFLFIGLCIIIYVLDLYDHDHDFIFDTVLTEIEASELDENLGSEITFVLFTDQYSTISYQMENNISQLARTYNEPVNFYKVNVTENDPACFNHQLTGIPSTLIFKDGKEITRVMGIVPVSNLKMIAKRMNFK